MLPVPINDNVRRQIFWVATLLLILLNLWVFEFELSLGRNLNQLVFYYGIIPARYTTPRGLQTLTLEGALIPIVVSMFLHGSWLHLLSNMLFLFVFGRSVENRFGHLTFLLIYLVSGMGGAFLHIFLNAGSRVPSIGASGAIAGVLGAYFVCFPRARVATVILPFFFWSFHLPAPILLGYWFLVQFFTGFQMLAIQSATAGGVAWWAHVGGFLVGVALAFALPPRRSVIDFGF
jgi:membrane associated rhomboid family serine protease